MKGFRVGDWVTIGIVMIVGAVLMLFSLFPKEAGAVLLVEYEGGEARYSLAEDREFDLISGGYTLHIVIKEQAAWISESDCPDGVCLHMGKMREAGDAVICVPAGVALRLEGEVSDDDVVAG